MKHFAIKVFYTLSFALIGVAAYGQTASKWFEEESTGCKVYNEASQPEESVQIVGNCLNGYLEGQGTVTWFLNGEFNKKLEGFYIKGKLNGQGSASDALSSKYVGEFKDGKPHGQGTVTTASGEKYVGEFKYGELHGNGTLTTAIGEKYVGEFKNGKPQGQGSFFTANGEKYIGEVKDGSMSGRGIIYDTQGNIYQSGIFKDNKLVTSQYIDPNSFTRIARSSTAPVVSDSQRQKELAKQASRISINASATQPDSSGVVTINIQTNTDTSSLKINGEELGGKADGIYSVKKVARVGQETKFAIAGIDVNGNTDTKTITVSRSVVESKVTYPQLNPDRVKRQPERDAVAVIIGISNYKSLPKAEFAKDDAQVFYDYAIRALGVKPSNIKLLMDEQADAEEIYTAFKTWLPARVKSTTDVYVFYSGHGLPTQDGSGLYWLPQRANRDLISKTGILLSEVNNDIQASKPKSVTIFMDACYSGQARGGETLIASARPIALKSQPTTFPSNFTVISASQADQISSSSPELQHGIFSYYLMRGMEGEADLNKDGKITLDEIQKYLSENVGRQARIMNRQQEPQVIGDGARVLVGR